MNIFRKTEVQTVISRCCTGLYLNWFKSYDTNAKKHKNAKNGKNIKEITSYDTNAKKMEKKILAFCVITFEPTNI